MPTLLDKVAIITGGASGLGEATVRRFAEEGAKVLICDLNETKGREIAREIGATFLRVDVTREADVEAAVAEAVRLHGRLDCMINNAGVVGPMESIAETTEAQWTSTITILLTGVFFGIKHASRVMIEQRDGCILSTASVSGISARGPHPYVAAKHALVGLTKSAASELSGVGIRVNAVAPGAVPTSMAVGMFGSWEAARENAALRSPLQRVIEPEDIADGFVYLAGPGGRNITGQVLTIDGGMTACPEASRFRDRTNMKFVGVIPEH